MAEYQYKDTTLITSHHPDSPGEGGRTWMARTEDNRLGAWGYSEAQALNNLVPWINRLAWGDELGDVIDHLRDRLRGSDDNPLD